MNIATRSSFLKEMGITEWTSRDAPDLVEPIAEISGRERAAALPPVQMAADNSATPNGRPGLWWFFGSAPQGDALVLFQNIIRVLGLSSHEWVWKGGPEAAFTSDHEPVSTPVIAVAFGGPVAQKLSGERDSLAQLRQTVLGFQGDSCEEIPLITSFDLNQLLSRPKDKALLWEDLLLARSVLHSL